MENNKQPQKYEDKVIVCVDCQEEFTFTAGEQDYYKQKGLFEPRRCKICRAKRKAERENGNNN